MTKLKGYGGYGGEILFVMKGNDDVKLYYKNKSLRLRGDGMFVVSSGGVIRFQSEDLVDALEALIGDETHT